VSALYLNPIFVSPSSHKYDTVDYDRVDPHLGGDAALRSLIGALRGRGMKLILDAVVNHTSERHPWFDRHGEHGGGAFSDPASPFRDRYVFASDDPDSYVGWKGVRTVPVVAGGEAREFAHIGVVRALERRNPMVQTLVGSTDIMVSRLTDMQYALHPADLRIRLAMPDVLLESFRQLDEIVEQGERMAERALADAAVEAVGTAS
jgi:hypothetical protein